MTKHFFLASKRLISSLIILTLLITSDLSIFASTPIVPPVQEQTQVIYQIDYVNEANGEKVHDSVRKIDFLGNEVTEEAIDIPGYKLADEAAKTLLLDDAANLTISFQYTQIDLEKLQALKEEVIEKIKALKKASLNEKYEYIERIEKAGTEEEVNKLYEEIVALDANKKVTVKYQIKGVDADSGKVLYSSLKTFAFSGDLIKATAETIEGYKLLSEPVQSVELGAEDAEILFRYRKVEQVKYKVRFVDKAGKDIDYALTKIDFSGNTVVEKAPKIKGYVLSSAAEQSLELTRADNQEILFVYDSVNEAALIKAKERAVKTIQALKKVDTDYFDSKLNHSWNQVKIDGKWYHLDSYHASYYHQHPEAGGDPYYAFLKSQHYLWKVIENRIWNDRYTEKSEENYPGKFTIEKDI